MGRISVKNDLGRLDSDDLDRNRIGLRQTMVGLEKRLIVRALERTRWHRGKAAELLQLNYKTLQRKMKAHGIK
jgi:DNA-binding NtrC family response regulator